ncbi:MAG: PIG-L deacetylase family protein [Candidatus Eremiobacterota bacterium]
MRILVIAAHPDDEVYGMGGTIAKLSSLGHQVYTLIVTEGCSTQYPNSPQIIEVKKEEALQCSRILNVKETIFGNLPDMKLDSLPHVEINAVIEKAIKTVKPDVVYTHHKGDINKDHRLVYESTLVACRPTPGQCVRKLLSYQVPSSTEWCGSNAEEIFIPNIFEEIEAFAEVKYQAISVYQTEIREYPHPRSLEYVRVWDQSTGMKVGLKQAEAFNLIRNTRM